MKTSGENYLETIFRLKQQSEYVRSIDVARETGYSKASVSRALVRLKKEEVITINEQGWILLTDKGLALAESLNEKKQVLKEFLVRFASVPEELAESDAEQLKHALSDDAAVYIKKALAKNTKLKTGGIHQRR